MSELDKAIEWFDEYGPTKELLPHAHTLADAARRFASLTSPETIEKAAKALYERRRIGAWDTASDGAKVVFRQVARTALEAVLRSVEEGKT